jgi:chemotaxis protein methyltransferase CheR
MLLNSATKRNKHYIIATDIDSRLLRHAKRGAFQHHDLLDDPLGLIPRYTVWREGHCVVADTIRTTVSFRNHNALLGSPIREPVDILLMRNLLTYLSPNAQARAMQASYDALKPGGAFVVSSPDIEINKGFTLLEPSVYIRL